MGEWVRDEAEENKDQETAKSTEKVAAAGDRHTRDSSSSSSSSSLNFDISLKIHKEHNEDSTCRRLFTHSLF
jgi:hypothetical protein